MIGRQKEEFTTLSFVITARTDNGEWHIPQIAKLAIQPGTDSGRHFENDRAISARVVGAVDVVRRRIWCGGLELPVCWFRVEDDVVVLCTHVAQEALAYCVHCDDRHAPDGGFDGASFHHPSCQLFGRISLCLRGQSQTNEAACQNRRFHARVPLLLKLRPNFMKATRKFELDPSPMFHAPDMSALGQKQTCAAGDVCFTPNSDRESRHPQTSMSALPPIADM